MFEELWKKSTPWLVLLAEMFQSLCKFQFEAGSSCLAVAVLPRAVTVAGVDFLPDPHDPHDPCSTGLLWCTPQAVIKSICGVLPSEQRLIYEMDLLEDPVLLTEVLPLEAPSGAMGCHGGNEWNLVETRGKRTLNGRFAKWNTTMSDILHHKVQDHFCILPLILNLKLKCQRFVFRTDFFLIPWLIKPPGRKASRHRYGTLSSSSTDIWRTR